MLIRFRRLAVVATLTLGAAGTAAAQAANGPEAAPSAAAAVAPATGPTLEQARVAARPLASTEARAANAAPARGGMGQPAALMIVGFGALLVGAIIGGDVGTIFMVGGAVVGLAGLYQYLK